MGLAGVILPCLVTFTPRSAQAQTTSLNAQMYAGINITAPVGSLQIIQYSTNLANTNGWITIGTVFMTNGTQLFVDKTSSGTKTRLYRAISNPVLANPHPDQLVWAPAGQFVMGSPVSETDRYSDEGPRTTVSFSHGFFISKKLVTQGEYQALMGYNPSWYNGERTVFVVSGFYPVDFGAEPSRPVECVTWNAANEYCFRLTDQESSAGRLPEGYVYRLPTEAEWEYACRAGTTTRFFYGSDSTYSQLGRYAWFSLNSTENYSGGSVTSTHAVGLKQPNPWGLYDMGGNVMQWCGDHYGSCPGGAATDWIGPSYGGAPCVVRGGSHSYDAVYCRSAARLYFDNAYNDGEIGFRVVLAPVLDVRKPRPHNLSKRGFGAAAGEFPHEFHAWRIGH
jgi:formylglycine-generating enzyme required for sulfatase activity